MTKPDPIEHAGIDFRRLVAAAHEIAHALGFAAAGVQVTEIKVYGHGQGHVAYPGGIEITNLYGFAVAHFAGRAADLRWCEVHGLPPIPERTCANDMRKLREFIRDVQAHGHKFAPSWAALRRDADRFVRAHWPTITRHTPRLARTGSLNPDRLPAVHTAA